MYLLFITRNRFKKFLEVKKKKKDKARRFDF